MINSSGDGPDIDGDESAMADDSKLRRKAKRGKRIRQVAAIPYRLDEQGGIEVLVITSQTTKRFVVPKGWPMKGKSGRKAAAIEARQEAGVVGKTRKDPAGRYFYWKRTSNSFVRVEVTVYLLEFLEQAPKWKEKRTRKRGWMTPEQAALLIDEPELASLVLALKGAASRSSPAQEA